MKSKIPDPRLAAWGQMCRKSIRRKNKHEGEYRPTSSATPGWRTEHLRLLSLCLWNMTKHTSLLSPHGNGAKTKRLEFPQNTRVQSDIRGGTSTHEPYTQAYRTVYTPKDRANKVEELKCPAWVTKDYRMSWSWKCNASNGTDWGAGPKARLTSLPTGRSPCRVWFSPGKS